MSRRTEGERIAQFDIWSRGYLSPEGDLSDAAPDFAHDRGELVALYRAMLKTRALDEKAVALQRTGRLGTYASSLGQEAVSVGIGAAMRPTDVFLPSFREQGAQLWRGVTVVEALLYWGGYERGSNFSGPREDFPICVTVGAQFAHAAGVACALSMRGEDRVAVAVGGDGSTSKGDFYEALNFVGAWKLPAVFVINNNQWAISVRRGDQTAAATLAQKAIAAGLPGEQVDGCDVIAVRAAVAEAIARAAAGEGGTLIECVSYRLSDHTTADDASRYRDDAEVSAAWSLEPVRRLREHLVAAHGWTKDEEETFRTEIRDEIEAGAEAYLAAEPDPPTAMFDYLYAELPAALAWQRAMVDGGEDG